MPKASKSAANHLEAPRSYFLEEDPFDMRLKNKQDFWSGIMFVAIGAGFAIGASSYSMGTSARMGPGYFPFWLGICLVLLGALVSLGAVAKTAEHVALEKFDWKILGIVIGSVVGCGVVLNLLGVYISIFLLVFFSSMASHIFSWKVAIVNGICLMIFVWLAFIKGLGLIFPLWPSFLNI
jgi:hypothetical protein